MKLTTKIKAVDKSGRKITIDVRKLTGPQLRRSVRELRKQGCSNVRVKV